MNSDLIINKECLDFMCELDNNSIKKVAIEKGFDFRSSIVGIVDIYQLQSDMAYEFIDSIKAENEEKALWLAKDRFL